MIRLLVKKGIPFAPSNLNISTQGKDFVLSWTPPLIRDWENLTYSVTVRNQVSNESRMTTTLSSLFTFSESIGTRDCQLYEFTLVSMNQVGLSTNGVFGSRIVPTDPRKIMSNEVMTTVSLAGGPKATLVFNAPAPCSDYPITGYQVAYSAYSDPNDLSVPQEQRRTLAFPRTQTQLGDVIELGTSNGLEIDRLVVVVITAVNSAGNTESEEITFRTTSAQSASVTINDSYIGTVSCDFAPGSTAQGCMVSFTQVDSNGNRTFLFNVNINVSRPTVNDVVFNEVPDGSEIVSTVQDLQSNGRVGLVSAPASVIGPFTPTTQPPQPDPTVSTTQPVVTISQEDPTVSTTQPLVTTSQEVFTTRPVVTTSQEGVSDSVIFTIIVFAVVAVLGLLVMVIVFCPCIRNRSRGNKVEIPREESTVRTRKLSDRSTLLDYQMREIVKYIPESMRIPSYNLKLQDAVGQGAFGIVYKGLLIDWNNVAIRGVALKILKGLFTQSDVQSMVSEISKMQEFHHPHVMSLIGVCLDTGPGASMVMPYMTNGSLLDYLKKERCNLDLTEGENSDKVFSVRKLLLKMCHQIGLGMAYLAQHKFVHRDLAARNCMLDSNGDLKVGDFGLAEDVYSTGYFRQSDSERVKLPYKWLALESLNDAIFNEKTDVWSYGVTVWEVFSGGRTPYPGVDPMSLVALLREGRRLEPPQNVACSTEMVSLMARCWYENSEERPSFHELAAELDRALTIMVGYVELNMELQVAITEKELEYDYVLSLEGQIKLSKASTEEVATETNASYGLRAEDQLQTEEVLVETTVAYGITKNLELNMELVAITEDEPECDFVLSPEEMMKLAKATTEEVDMETNAAYGLRARNELQTEQVLVETNVAYGMRIEQENPAKQVTKLANPFNSESHTPLRSGYRGTNSVNTAGFANLPHM
ncbi:uncharacterized protein LOC135344191 isoform X2 [Halichondria panicea]|uniref:uncharacterized protein LOC135344191 isoform X2 n=1 Tax=Halichondria panicea TaxID=6063 RepID=UPI00312B433B